MALWSIFKLDKIETNLINGHFQGKLFSSYSIQRGKRRGVQSVLASSDVAKKDRL